MSEMTPPAEMLVPVPKMSESVDSFQLCLE